MEDDYKIYKLIDPIDERIRYVGMTINSLKQRLKSHRNEKSKSHKSAWVNSLKKNGLAPKIELIETVNSYKLACEKETYWIDKLKKDGHNLTNHATGGNKNKRMSLETRQKMSESHKARNKIHKRVMSEESKKRLSSSKKELMKDPKNRERLRIASKKYEDSKSEEQRLKDILVQAHKVIIQYDLDMNPIREFVSINQACKTLGIHSSNVSKCCHLKVSTVGGYVWRFKGDVTPIRQYKKRETKKVFKFDKSNNLIEEYQSAEEAAIKNKISINKIRHCCKKSEIYLGFRWSY